MSVVQLLFRKWWVVLLQGILLIVLSIYIFQHPVAMLAGLSFWIGVLVLATGLLGIMSWVGADKAEREDLSLVSSIVTLLFGLLMLSNMFATMRAITIALGIWLVSTALQLIRSGWSLRHRSSLGWVALGAGVVSGATAAMMILNVGAGAAVVSAMFALPVMVTGIALVLLSFAKKALVSNLKDRFEHLGTRGG